MPFTFSKTSLPGVTIIQPSVFTDHRGFFMEAYKKSKFASAGIDVDFVQDTTRGRCGGTLRDLHAARPEGPRVAGARGRRRGVRRRRGYPSGLVDLRQVGQRDAGQREPPIGLHPGRSAHGFCAISPEAQILYRTSDEYPQDLEWGVRWVHPLLAILWPVSDPRLSQCDER